MVISFSDVIRQIGTKGHRGSTNNYVLRFHNYQEVDLLRVESGGNETMISGNEQ